MNPSNGIWEHIFSRSLLEGIHGIAFRCTHECLKWTCLSGCWYPALWFWCQKGGFRDCYMTYQGCLKRRILRPRHTQNSSLEYDMLQVSQLYENLASVTLPQCWVLSGVYEHMLVRKRARPTLCSDWGSQEAHCQVGKPLLGVYFNGAMTHRLSGQTPVTWHESGWGVDGDLCQGQGRAINLWNYSCHSKCWELFKKQRYKRWTSFRQTFEHTCQPRRVQNLGWEGF